MTDEKILITGSQSFVGTNYIRYSKFRNIDEVSLFENTPNEIDYKSYDVVIHLVAIVHQTRRANDSEYFKINRDLCIEVAKEAKRAGVKQFLFLSTVKVYGSFHSNSEPWNESSACFPEDAYGKSKYEAEKILRTLEDENFTVSIIRTPLVYGEGVRANMKSIIKLVEKSIILPFKDIRNKRNFTSAENLVAFIDRIIDLNASGTFIAMDKIAISTTDLVKMISENLGRKIYLFRTPNFIIKIGMIIMPSFFERLYGSYEMDNSDTLRILGFEPPFTTQESIKKMIGSLGDESA
ncbi:MAG: NAD-dependent epimerase/dehydratase family protein [Bacteroidales bacterium]|jgi:UDP-glucose 4-epimerase|nr:NAD-dependent epimerase/dehydratase family protein [Bacteroidales bacterium]